MSTARARVRSVSIRLRLTLLYTGILALTLVAFGSIVYWSQSQTTYDGIRSNLIGQAQNFATGTRVAGRIAARTGWRPTTRRAGEARPA